VSDDNRVVSAVLRAKRLVRDLAQLKSDGVREGLGANVAYLATVDVGDVKELGNSFDESSDSNDAGLREEKKG
jgi:hypothetical protein